MLAVTGDDAALTEIQIEAAVAEALAGESLAGRKILAVLPDLTRTAPVPAFFRAFYRIVTGGGGTLDCLVASGTHPPLGRERRLALLGLGEKEYRERYAACRVYDHVWDDPARLSRIGTIPAERTAAITGGLLAEDVPVEINSLVLAYDLLLVLSPVVPHEVVGFSGGSKYFFPGLAGEGMIDFLHWLGALLTIPGIIGRRDTPVRALLDEAAALLPVARVFFNVVMGDGGPRGIFAGPDESSWRAAADLSSRLHIHDLPRRYRSVLGMAHTRYDDLWTAAKAAYKLDGIVEDGGELIVYAPHLREVSYTHGRLIDEVGYHVRDYFLAQAERFRAVPGRIKAHSTHVKGTGSFSGGREEPRINVVLATAIPEERCRRINLAYRDPRSIRPEDWAGREDEGLFLVREAGERLYRYGGGQG
ncbi:MAG: lactate racemase domain-containing protein [Patescibacteria group bacterium]